MTYRTFILSLLTALLMYASLASAAPIGALAVCSTNDDELASAPEERCAFSFAADGSLVTSGAEARMGDGKLTARSQRDLGASPLQRVEATVSDTIFFTGGDPAGFPVEISMWVHTRLLGELTEMDAFMSMNIQSTDGSDVGGFAAAAVARLDGELELIELVADWAPGWTVLGGSVVEQAGAPDELLAKVSMHFDWQREFNPLHFSAGLSLFDFPGSGGALLESYNSGIELIIPEGVTLVSGSGQFLVAGQGVDVPAPASLLLVMVGLVGLLTRVVKR